MSVCILLHLKITSSLIFIMPGQTPVLVTKYISLIGPFFFYVLKCTGRFCIVDYTLIDY